MNFTQIFHGMVGRDFIKAFNDNFTITDKTFLEILATLIYKVKSTDIKEFKVIDNVVSYTLEEAPEEGQEDTREWTPVDITKWGNIQGDITEQTDLWNILEDKAAVDTVATIDNLLSTLRTDYELTKTQVGTNTSNIRTNTNDIADLLETITEKVNSTNIKAIRLNNAVFQWSPDGRTWYEQPIVTSIAWGHLTGDITTQEDLMAYFTNINTNFDEVDGLITSLRNDLTSLQTSLGNLNSALNTHLEDFDNYKNQVTNSLSEIRSIAEDATSAAGSTDANLQAHLEDYDNPHHVTKETINLGNVDNTADTEKPISTAQKRYVDTQIETVKQEIADKSGLVFANGFINTIFVGNQNDYDGIGPKSGVLAFIIDGKMITASVILSSDNYSEFDLYKNGTKLTPTTSSANIKTYEDIPRDNDSFVVKVMVDSVEMSYNIRVSYSTVNDVNVDKLVEGGNK